MTFPETLSATEKSAIEELQIRMKSSLTPKLCEDPTLFYRFLKARDFNVDKAEKMLLKHIHWRKIHQADTILDDFKPREYFLKHVLPSIIGTDKEGDMVVYCASGKFEPSEAVKCDTSNGHAKSWIWFCERNSVLLRKQSEKTGRECMQLSFIIDLDKLSLSNATNKSTAEVWLTLTHLFQDNYPERLKSSYIINAPSYYVMVFSLLKTVMSGAMLQKIHVLGHKGFKETLLNKIDPDVLPAFLGGNRTDPDGNPLCKTFVNHSDKIPSELYLSNDDRYFKDKSEVRTIVVPHSEKREIYAEVAEIGSLIQWEFLVKSKDIGFGLSLHLPKQSRQDVLIPVEKYSTPDGIETGFYKAHSVGKYMIIFDNSHSWRNSKEIEYKVTVIKPE